MSKSQIVREVAAKLGMPVVDVQVCRDIVQGVVARQAMRDPQTLESALQALLEERANEATAIGSEYDDVAIEIALYRAERTDEKAMHLAQAGEGLVQRIDDMGRSAGPIWQAASLAIDPYVA
jgi:hypothetical protein